MQPVECENCKLLTRQLAEKDANAAMDKTVFLDIMRQLADKDREIQEAKQDTLAAMRVSDINDDGHIETILTLQRELKEAQAQIEQERKWVAESNRSESANLEACDEVTVGIIRGLKRQLAEAKEDIEGMDLAAEAHDAKLKALSAHETCACDYDRPGDVCAHHSPKLDAALRELKEAREEVEARIPFDETTLTVNILRSWDRALIERFAAHLLGDTVQALLVQNAALRKALEDLLFVYGADRGYGLQERKNGARELAEMRKNPLLTFDKIGADRLADEVAVLIRERVIDSRSPAGDALLDYREPPSSERADRIAELQRELWNAKDKERDALDDSTALHESFEARVLAHRKERESLNAQNAALVRALERIDSNFDLDGRVQTIITEALAAVKSQPVETKHDDSED